MKKYPPLRAGDSVEIIAPASRCSDPLLMEIVTLLRSFGLNCIVSPDIFGDDLLCANRDDIRFEHLKNALLNPKTKAVICARGGYGSMRLIPALSALTPPEIPKLFVGMSDITALHLFLQETWQWPVIHGAFAVDKFSAESIAALKMLLFGETQTLRYQGLPLNPAAKSHHSIRAPVTGGNLSLVQASLGTRWQINGNQKIILLEEINERGYRVDRMLEHLRQAGVFQNASAIILGDFLEGKEPNGTSLIQPVLNRFAESCSIPVVQIKGIGHGHTSFPIPLGTAAKLDIGHRAVLTMDMNVLFDCLSTII